MRSETAKPALTLVYPVTIVARKRRPPCAGRRTPWSFGILDAASAAIAREKPVSIDGLLELAKPDMAKVDALIRDRMQSPVSVIPALAGSVLLEQRGSQLVALGQ